MTQEDDAQSDIMAKVFSALPPTTTTTTTTYEVEKEQVSRQVRAASQQFEEFMFSTGNVEHTTHIEVTKQSNGFSFESHHVEENHFSSHNGNHADSHHHEELNGHIELHNGHDDRRSSVSSAHTALSSATSVSVHSSVSQKSAQIFPPLPVHSDEHHSVASDKSDETLKDEPHKAGSHISETTIATSYTVDSQATEGTVHGAEYNPIHPALVHNTAHVAHCEDYSEAPTPIAPGRTPEHDALIEQFKATHGYHPPESVISSIISKHSVASSRHHKNYTDGYASDDTDAVVMPVKVTQFGFDSHVVVESHGTASIISKRQEVYNPYREETLHEKEPEQIIGVVHHETVEHHHTAHHDEPYFHDVAHEEPPFAAAEEDHHETFTHVTAPVAKPPRSLVSEPHLPPERHFSPVLDARSDVYSTFSYTSGAQDVPPPLPAGSPPKTPSDSVSEVSSHAVHQHHTHIHAESEVHHHHDHDEGHHVSHHEVHLEVHEPIEIKTQHNESHAHHHHHEFAEVHTEHDLVPSIQGPRVREVLRPVSLKHEVEVEQAHSPVKQLVSPIGIPRTPVATVAPVAQQPIHHHHYHEEVHHLDEHKVEKIDYHQEREQITDEFGQAAGVRNLRSMFEQDGHVEVKNGHHHHHHHHHEHYHHHHADEHEHHQHHEEAPVEVHTGVHAHSNETKHENHEQVFTNVTRYTLENKSRANTTTSVVPQPALEHQSHAVSHENVFTGVHANTLEQQKHHEEVHHHEEHHHHDEHHHHHHDHHEHEHHHHHAEEHHHHTEVEEDDSQQAVSDLLNKFGGGIRLRRPDHVEPQNVTRKSTSHSLMNIDAVIDEHFDLGPVPQGKSRASSVASSRSYATSHVSHATSQAPSLAHVHVHQEVHGQVGLGAAPVSPVPQLSPRSNNSDQFQSVRVVKSVRQFVNQWGQKDFVPPQSPVITAPLYSPSPKKEVVHTFPEPTTRQHAVTQSSLHTAHEIEEVNHHHHHHEQAPVVVPVAAARRASTVSVQSSRSVQSTRSVQSSAKSVVSSISSVTASSVGSASVRRSVNATPTKEHHSNCCYEDHEHHHKHSVSSHHEHNGHHHNHVEVEHHHHHEHAPSRKDSVVSEASTLKDERVRSDSNETFVLVPVSRRRAYFEEKSTGVVRNYSIQRNTHGELPPMVNVLED